MMKKNYPFLLLLIGLFLNTGIFAQSEFDTTFNSTGRSVIPTNFAGTPADIAITPDNKILMTSGCAHINYGYSNICTVRLNEDGSLDTTFHNGDNRATRGTVVSAFQEPLSGVSASTSLDLQSDGKIIVGGRTQRNGVYNYLVVRYNANGSFDTSFGTNGFVTGIINENTYLNDLKLLPDGKILFVGYTGNTIRTKYVARLNANGSLDNSFGINGIAIFSSTDFSSIGSSIAVQPDGKIVTGGFVTTIMKPPMSSYLFARLNPDGTFDQTFDEDGAKIIPIPGTIRKIAIQTDGRILGLGNNIVFRLNSDGSFDTTFDGDGSRQPLPSPSVANGLYVSASGKVMVVGSFQDPNGGPPYHYRVAQFLPNGAPDPDFSDDGYMTIDVHPEYIDGADVVTADSKGRIVIGGRSAPGIINSPWTNSIYSAVRFAAPPPRNVGFSGRVTKSDGRAVVNAYITLKSGSDIIGYARTNPFGYFHFASVPTNVTYKLSTVSKGLDFYDRNVLVDGAIDNYLVVSQ